MPLAREILGFLLFPSLFGRIHAGVNNMRYVAYPHRQSLGIPDESATIPIDSATLFRSTSSSHFGGTQINLFLLVSDAWDGLKRCGC
jgi:hypothetical protein